MQPSFTPALLDLNNTTDASRQALALVNLTLVLLDPALLDLGVPMQDAPHDPQSPFSCPQSYCAADLNYDFVIDGQDLAAVLLDWNTLPAPSCDPRWADINGNGTVGGDDLALVLAGWGPCAP